MREYVVHYHGIENRLGHLCPHLTHYAAPDIPRTDLGLNPCAESSVVTLH